MLYYNNGYNIILCITSIYGLAQKIYMYQYIV